MNDDEKKYLDELDKKRKEEGIYRKPIKDGTFVEGERDGTATHVKYDNSGGSDVPVGLHAADNKTINLRDKETSVVYRWVNEHDFINSDREQISKIQKEQFEAEMKEMQLQHDRDIEFIGEKYSPKIADLENQIQMCSNTSEDLKNNDGLREQKLLEQKQELLELEKKREELENEKHKSDTELQKLHSERIEIETQLKTSKSVNSETDDLEEELKRNNKKIDEVKDIMVKDFIDLRYLDQEKQEAVKKHEQELKDFDEQTKQLEKIATQMNEQAQNYKKELEHVREAEKTEENLTRVKYDEYAEWRIKEFKEKNEKPKTDSCDEPKDNGNESKDNSNERQYDRSEGDERTGYG